VSEDPLDSGRQGPAGGLFQLMDFHERRPFDQVLARRTARPAPTAGRTPDVTQSPDTMGVLPSFLRYPSLCDSVQPFPPHGAGVRRGGPGFGLSCCARVSEPHRLQRRRKSPK
jgi:hypothetical protein